MFINKKNIIKKIKFKVNKIIIKKFKKSKKKNNVF